MKNIVIVTILVFFLSGCASQQLAQQSDPLSETELLLDSSLTQLSRRNTKKAIVGFNKVISLCEDQYSSHEGKVYASRGAVEALYYMVKAAASGESAIAVSSTCSDALYFRGYASLDLGQVDLAEKYIKKAIAMAPVNSVYLSELGHIYHSKRDWENALGVFAEAEKAATYSPPDLMDTELARAKRGVGYSLIELGKLDEAERKFKECLEINENDEGALKELNYIETLRSNMPNNS